MLLISFPVELVSCFPGIRLSTETEPYQVVMRLKIRD